MVIKVISFKMGLQVVNVNRSLDLKAVFTGVLSVALPTVLVASIV